MATSLRSRFDQVGTPAGQMRLRAIIHPLALEPAIGTPLRGSHIGHLSSFEFGSLRRTRDGMWL
jgi:hypothetical protein